jgi:hypothetical protein
VYFYYLEKPCRLPYNIIIDRRETNMTDNDFFKLDQQQWYQEFVESELPEKVCDTNPQPEKFTLEDTHF